MSRLVVFLLFVAFCAYVSKFSERKSAAAEQAQGITIASGANLRDCLAAIRRSHKHSVLSEIPFVERKLKIPLKDAPLKDALAAISSSFHLHWIRQGNRLVFLRRYIDPREATGIELEELQGISTDVYRLVREFAPDTGEVGSALAHTKRQNAFVESLTGEQIKSMRGGGLSLADLAQTQREEFLRINRHMGFNHAVVEARRNSEMYRGFRQAYLGYVTARVSTRSGVVQERNSFRFVYPYRHPEVAPNTEGSFAITERPSQLPGDVDAEPSGEELLLPKSVLTKRFERLVQLRDGDATLGRVIDTVRTAAGCEIRMPSYGEKRKMLAYINNTSAEDVLGGIWLIWRWQLQFERGTRYSLGRPALAPAKSAVDLSARTQIAFPPAVWLLWSRDGTTSARWVARYHVQMNAIKADVTRASGEGWKRVNVADMSPDLQTRLANWVLDAHMRTQWQALQRTGALCFAEPERGYLTLDGPIEPGKQPLLEFKVDRPNGPPDSWGWFVGSSGVR